MKFNHKTYQLLLIALFMQLSISFAQNNEEPIDSVKVIEEQDYEYEQAESDSIVEEAPEEVIEAATDETLPNGVVKAPAVYKPLTEETSKEWRQEEDKTYETNTISEKTIQKYKQDKDFQYFKKERGVRTKRENWFSRALNAFFDILEKLFGFKISEDVFTVIKWILIIGILGTGIVLLLRYLGVSINFKPKKKKEPLDISFAEIEENLEEINFNELIEKAIKTKAYRVAVRLYFLKNLQSLTKRDLIEWEIDKTNVDYKYELENTKLNTDFEQIVYLFEHIWYGDFELEEEEYQQAINVFQKFDKRLGYEK